MTRFLIEQWNRSKRRLPAAMPQPRRVTLVTSVMARPVIEQFAEDIRQAEQLEVQVLPIVNKFFGEEVTVAGLLCGQDVLDALEENGNLGDLVLLPRVMLDNEGVRFLDDVTVENRRYEVTAPVWTSDPIARAIRRTFSYSDRAVGLIRATCASSMLSRWKSSSSVFLYGPSLSEMPRKRSTRSVRWPHPARRYTRPKWPCASRHAKL